MIIRNRIGKRIAIIDDDTVQANHLKNAVEKLGFIVRCFSSPRNFINSLHHDAFDLALLDWMLPEMTGIDVLQHIRQFDPKLPVLMISCRTGEEDIVHGLEAGADDYVIKPVNVPILMARIRALLRRIEQEDFDSDKPFDLGIYRFDPGACAVSFYDQKVVLTNREFALARLFFRNPNRPFARQYLLECLWGKSPDMQTRTLDTHVARLRTKLDLCDTNGVKLTTLYGYGYRLELASETLDAA